LKVWPDDLIEYGHAYKMELHFPELSWLGGQAVKVKVLWNLDALDIGSNWTTSGGDTWFLSYHLKATERVITHGEVFNLGIKLAYDGAMWIDAIDLGEYESLLIPDTPLPEAISKNWKWLVGIVITVLVLLVILPYGYTKGR